MDKFCDFITNPDWWSVVATIIAAIVAACITSKFSKRQTELQEQQLKIQEHQNELQEQQIKLQEQQNKQQEYNLYRELYKSVLAVHQAADGFIFKIYSNIAMGDLKVYPWDKTLDKIQQLQNDLQSAEIHIKLKLPEDAHRISQYSFLISTMIGLINRIIIFDNNNHIIKPSAVNITMILNNMKRNDDYLIPIILSQIEENDLKEDFKRALIGVSIMKKEFCEDAFLGKIKAKI